MWEAPSFGFVIVVRVVSADGSHFDHEVFIDSGSPLAWVQSGQKVSYDDPSHKMMIRYLDSSGFRGVGHGDAKIIFAPGTQHALELHNQYVAIGNLYADIPEHGATGYKQPAQTLEMGAGMLGLSPHTQSRKLLYTLAQQQGKPELIENPFPANINTPFSAYEPKSQRKVAFNFTPYGSDAQSELIFGDYDAARIVTDPSSIVSRPAEDKSSGHWKLSAKVAYGTDKDLLLAGNARFAHWDTGYARIGLPSDLYKKYMEATGAREERDRLILTEAQFKALKTMYFLFGKTVIQLRPDAQIWPRDFNQREGFSSNVYISCVGELLPQGKDPITQEDIMPDIILGISFREHRCLSFSCPLLTLLQRNTCSGAWTTRAAAVRSSLGQIAGSQTTI